MLPNGSPMALFLMYADAQYFDLLLFTFFSNYSGTLHASCY